jgi:Acetyltransferase (GNAT) domain
MPIFKMTSRGCAETTASVVSPAPREVWREVLDADPGATALQTPNYFAAVVRCTGGRDASRLYLLPDGRRLILPLIRLRSTPGLPVLADFPGGFGHGSLLATDGLQADDVRTVVNDLRRHVLSARLGGGHHTAEQWAAGPSPGVVEVPRRVDVIDLDGGWQDVFGRGFSRSARYNVRKAERAGVEVERDTNGRLIPVFYNLYLAWVDRWIPHCGLPPAIARHSALRQEPRRKFETVAAMLAEECRVFVAWHRGRPVASCITLVHGQHAIGWRSYSIKELAAPVCANNLVQARAVADACEAGCRFFDLGQSGDVASLLSYKSSLGSTPRRVVDLRIERPAVTYVRGLKDSTQRIVVGALAHGSDLASRDPETS